MTNSDFFIQTSGLLHTSKRYKEHVELCEFAIASAVWPSSQKRQCEALCRWTLAETYYYSIGDAKKARESYVAFLQFVDNDISMIRAFPTLREVMEDMYVKACTDMGQLAISYDEYFEYIRKSEIVRPLTEKQAGQLASMEYNRTHGISWCNNILQLAELEIRSAESGAIDRLPCAIAMCSLLLLYPETDAPIDVLRTAITNYSALVCQLVGESFLYCAQRKHPANPDNYRFIFEQAIELVSEYVNDMETQAVAKEAQQRLIEGKSESVDKSNFLKYGYASASPPEAPDYVPPLVLKEKIKKHLTTPQQNPQSCCLSILLIVVFAGYAIYHYFIK